jgi:hypothetical protein
MAYQASAPKKRCVTVSKKVPDRFDQRIGHHAAGFKRRIFFTLVRKKYVDFLPPLIGEMPSARNICEAEVLRPAHGHGGQSAHLATDPALGVV